MKSQTHAQIDVPSDLVEAIRAFSQEREVEHCGRRWTVSPFDLYATCPQCGTRLKVRAFSGVAELEDVFDAVFEWMGQPGADALARRRQREIEADSAD